MWFIFVLASSMVATCTPETKLDVLADLTVLVNSTVKMPCDLTSRGPADSPVIVLWYKGKNPEPFYSYDLRQTRELRHWSDESVFGNRALFDIKENPPILKVDPVRQTDEEEYRCRVDFETGPAKSSTVRLTVIVLPSRPVITDESGSIVSAQAGPYHENGRVILTCKTLGGRPSPQLVWIRDGKVTEDSYTLDHRGQVRNLLHLEYLTRDYLDATFTCRAKNNNITGPLDASIVINMTLKPLTISLLKESLPQDFVSAGVMEALECSSTGSRPDAVISWWRNEESVPQTQTKLVSLVNKTISTYRFIPKPSDNGIVITCRVENQLLPEAVLEETYKLNVYYMPLVELILDKNLNPNDVREGSDVLFSCRVLSNPKFHKLVWTHEGNVLSHNVSAGIIHSNQSLALQRIDRSGAGRYNCKVANHQGETTSNSVYLKVLYAPVCRVGQKTEYQVSRHDTSNISCQVDAEPKNVTFSWRFNNSGSLLELGDSRASSQGTISFLPYTPASPGDYGLLLCSSLNIIGTQGEPCTFNITAAKPPDLIRDCAIRNQTTHSVFVSCRGIETELPTTFIMEVRNSEDLNLVARVTNTTPQFVATGLAPGTAYTLHVSVISPMGTSMPIKLEAFTVKTAEKRMGISEPSEEVFGVSPVTIVISGVAAGIIITVAVILALAIKLRPRRHPAASCFSPSLMQSNPSDSVISSPKETMSTFSRPSPGSDDNNPDVVPLREDCNYAIQELKVPTCQQFFSSQGVQPCHSGAHIACVQQQQWEPCVQYHHCPAESGPHHPSVMTLYSSKEQREIPAESSFQEESRVPTFTPPAAFMGSGDILPPPLVHSLHSQSENDYKHESSV